MAWDDISFEQRDHYLGLYKSKDKQALLEAAREEGMSPRTLARRCREHDLYKRKYASRALSFPTYVTKTFSDYPVLEWDRAILTSDYEEPFADPLMKQLAYLMALRYDIPNLVINGDFLAADQPGISSHSPVHAEDMALTYQSSIDQAALTLETFLGHFSEIVGNRGNHDDMVSRVTGGQVDLGMLLSHVKGYRYTEYAYIVVRTSRGPYLVCHPRQYRNNALSLAQSIYGVYATEKHEKAHIVIGHTHHSASGRSPDNLRECHALGCMRHPQMAQYKNLNITTHYQWNQGFGMLLDGYFHNLTLEGTDWKFYLKDMCPEAVWYRTMY